MFDSLNRPGFGKLWRPQKSEHAKLEAFAKRSLVTFWTKLCWQPGPCMPAKGGILHNSGVVNMMHPQLGPLSPSDNSFAQMPGINQARIPGLNLRITITNFERWWGAMGGYQQRYKLRGA